jgi:hypothetical protein
VVVPWAVLVGWGVALSREQAEGGPAPRGRTAAVAAAAAALLLAALHGTSVVVERAAAADQSPESRHDRALTALRVAPWRVRPALLAAASALELGDRQRCAEASRLLARVRWWRPGSAAISTLDSGLAICRGDLPAAAARAWEASRRRPYDPHAELDLAHLVDQLEAARNVPP